ncbi:MAG TPA: bifunctional UDP-sugar hydrolase/5'-nucleotidase, partial [Candidatus Obscuribacter sp.]|nr:bifunctional UDP-sugar hydrolase/5'-nucleotidase [Candidatus Obscuribacter sp.]
MTTGTTTRGQSKRLKSLLLSTLPAFTLSMLILLAASLPHACADKIPATEFTLTILHTNDLHSHAEPFLERGKNVGGMARIAHLLRKLKKENKNCLTIDAGDIFQGTPLFTRYKGEVEVELLNKLGYDLYTIGNHEFDEGGINLADKLARARFDVICANLDAAQLPALARVMKPSVIKELGDSKVKVGFVGAITPDIESLSMRRDGARLKRDATKAKEAAWLAPIQEEVSKLKDQGIDKIILVTHCGVDYDKVIAENIAEVDAIIGGHSHSRLSEPVLVNRGEAGPCLIVQTGSYGRSLGQLQLTFDKNGSVLPEKSKYRLLAVNDRLPEEPDVKAYIDKMAEPLKILKETVLTRADGNFDNSWRLYRHDSALGDLIADAFLDAGQSQGVQVAMENRGGIRSFIDRGPITLEKIEEILPFDNHLACATVTGKSLLRNLEHSVAGSLGGRFLDVSGIKFAYDIEKAPGSRIVFALVKDKEGNWKRVEDTATYRIGMTDYSFNGGEGYDFSSAADVTY